MNEILFLGFAVFLLTLNLASFRFGKLYIFLLIVVYSLLMNIFVTKQFVLFGFQITGGNALYGAIFLLTDLLSEHYGKKEAFRSIIMGFMVMLIFIVSTQFLMAFRPSELDFAQESIAILFSLTPRISIGSLLPYALAQSLDVWLFDWVKQKTKGRFLFLRNNFSTLISQLVDTIIFTAVGLTAFRFLPIDGFIDPAIFWEVCLATYTIKVIVATLDTPFLYLSYKFIPSELQS